MTVQYDATHSCGIQIDFDQFCEFTLEDCVTNLKAYSTVYSDNARVCSLFGVDQTTEEEAEAAYLKAVQDGNPIFWIEYGEHSIEWIHIHNTKAPRKWQGIETGFIVCDRMKWVAVTHKLPLAALIFREVCEWFEDIDNAIKGCLFQWSTVDQDGSDSGERCGGFRTEEEALQDALSCYPQCQYDESRFEVTRSYRLAV